jgi:hypothetical protein
MLTEATRKVWTSIIISKIQHASRQFHTMNEAQHGYKRNRGTDSASLVFINLVESAEASKDTSHRTSYDMSRAFDAVSKNVQAIAWRRLGVPDDIADWLVDMDVAGVTVVRSPFSQARWEEALGEASARGAGGTPRLVPVAEVAAHGAGEIMRPVPE